MLPVAAFFATPAGQAAAGALISLATTAIQDVFDGGPNPEAASKLKVAKNQAIADMIQSGVDPTEANAKAQEMFEAGINAAAKDPTSVGDYVGAALVGGAIGGGAGLAFKGVSKLGSFIGKKGAQTAAKAPTAAPTAATAVDDMSQMAPGRMPMIGEPSKPAMNLAAPGPTGMPMVKPELPAARSAARGRPAEPMPSDVDPFAPPEPVLSFSGRPVQRAGLDAEDSMRAAGVNMPWSPGGGEMSAADQIRLAAMMAARRDAAALRRSPSWLSRAGD